MEKVQKPNNFEGFNLHARKSTQPAVSYPFGTGAISLVAEQLEREAEQSLASSVEI
jgi:hypothetical protein